MNGIIKLGIESKLYCLHGRLHCLTCGHSAYYPK